MVSAAVIPRCKIKDRPRSATSHPLQKKALVHMGVHVCVCVAVYDTVIKEKGEE